MFLREFFGGKLWWNESFWKYIKNEKFHYKYWLITKIIKKSRKWQSWITRKNAKIKYFDKSTEREGTGVKKWKLKNVIQLW